MKTGKYTRLIATLLLLLMCGVGKVWADNITIFVQKSDGTTQTITGAGGSVNDGITGGSVSVAISVRDVTLTVTPADNYKTKKDLIVVEKMVDPSSHAPRRALNIGKFPVGGPDGWVTVATDYTFTVTSDYEGAYVIVTFVENTPTTATRITSLSEIDDLTGNYELAADIDASGYNLGEFTGTLDGKYFTISHLNHPLFASTDGATIRNINFENVNISAGDANGDAGAITSCAKGATRIYNCGILPTTTEYDADGNVIGFLGSSVGGSGNVGGLVGKLEGSARVINSFSYANITSGTTVGGIVGNNTVTTTATSLNTMVMNCMFFGNITGGTSKAPIYNGTKITNVGENTGVSNFNYFWEGASYVQNKQIDANKYNCALSAETRYLQRFEFYRHLLNSNRELAAWWATGDETKKNEMLKWVLDKSVAPYPILKEQGYYPSVVNHISAKTSPSDNSSVVDYTASTAPETPETQKTLSVTLSGDGITTASLTLPITNKDPDNYNFNYHTVQLPYFNDVGTGNYKNGQVVTGWEVTVSGGTHSYTTGAEGSATVNETTGELTLSTPYNFADRNSTGKDDYGTSGRIFSQGAYFDVPEGVSSISIRPHWAKAVFIADASLDVVYDQGMSTAYNVPNVGGGVRYTNGESYTFTSKEGNITLPVYTKLGDNDGALAALSPSGSVYDNALVLVGNFHTLSLSSEAENLPYTIMSADFNHDNEPDYSYILRFNDRKRVHPVRLDFLDVIGLGMAQKSTGGSGTYNLGIMQPYGWFECTNTGLFRVTQFEYDKTGRANSPMILQGGVIEQWVTVGQTESNVIEAESVTYYHVGGNVWFKEFHIGVHQDKTDKKFVSPHPPISVTGGDFDEFYLTGLYNTPNNNYDDNAECYINGGRFGKVAGTGMQGLGKTANKGNIIWQIDNADIDEFYAGGINAAHIATGNIYTVISNSRVDQFCGGPKFGDMNSNKKVVTNATNCTFRTFFGAGYGGNSYNRRYPTNYYNKYNYDWNTWLTGAASYDYSYDSKYNGVETRIDYQFIPKSDNTLNVARLFIDYVSFSLATTHDVTSILNGCTITKNKLGRLDLFEECTGNFYGGGSLGKVTGDVKSTLTNCTVEGNVFGAGYSATLPTVNVMLNRFQREPSYDENTGAYTEAILPATIKYSWEHAETVNSDATAIDKTNHILYTTEDLTSLGKVAGTATLNIDGTTTVVGNVYGGGEESDVAENTNVNMTGGTINQNVYGGGKGKADNFTCDKAMVGEVNTGIDAQNNPLDGGTTVNITNGTVEGDVYGGGEVGRVERNTIVTIGEAGNTSLTPIVKGHVFGAGKGVETHGYSALVRGNATVTIQGQAQVWQNVHGGGEKASVGRYNVRLPGDTEHTEVRVGMPYSLKAGGKCTINIQDNATIGKDANSGDVYGAGQGITPSWSYTEYTSSNAYTDRIRNSRRMVNYSSTDHPDGKQYKEWDYYEDEAGKKDTRYVWEYFTTEDDYLLYVETLARASETDVVIGGKRVSTNITPSSDDPTIKGSVYGGSESGFVYYSTEINIPKGTVKGDVFGGGKGLASFAEAGRVRRNTNLTISGGAVEGNVYGGGSLGDVGTIDKTDRDEETDELTYNYKWKKNDGTTPNDTEINKKIDLNTNTGICKVTITGGSTIGVNNPVDATKQGNVFGAGRGSAITWWCEKATAYATSVTITDATVKGNVYGGGQIGRVEDDAKVTIGTVDETGDSKPTITGSVYGAGAGLHTHGYSALVRGNSDVAVQGTALIGGSVFGGGEIASVGRFTVVGGLPKHPDSGGHCTVTIQDNAKIGSSGTGHNVYGACKGVDPSTISAEERKSMQLYSNRPKGAKDVEGTYWDYYKVYPQNYTGPKFVWVYYTADEYPAFLRTLALTSHPHVTISENVSVYGSVYGGGQRGVTLGNVDVDITGGTVYQDVYGGGALADTNVGNWDADSYTVVTGLTPGVSSVTGLYERSGAGTKESPYTYTLTADQTANGGKTYYSKGKWADASLMTAKYTTTVNLTGGLIKGDAYGGGLGQKNGFNGASSDIAAVVWGDINVNLGSSSSLTATAFYLSKYGAPHADVVKSGRVFGCNNLMGSPQGNVTVTVYRTVRSKDNEGNDIARTAITRNDEGEITSVATPHIYDVAAVYGGGNLADYTTSGKKASVIIYSCDASIESVYGGGNAAEVPGTDVLVRGAWEIEEVFGGGNGKDPYTTDGGTNWVSNPGANIGNSTIPGNANTLLTGGLIHAAYGGSNEKGTIYGNVQIDVGTGGDCNLDVEKMVGAGKNADVNGNLVMILGCKPSTKIPVLYAGADQANVNGNVELTITSGNYGKVFGGNNLSGAIKGHIKLNIEETGNCETPIIIDKLYLGGNEAAYSRYGYYVETSDDAGVGNPNETAVLTDAGKLHLIPRESASDTHKPVKSYSYDEEHSKWVWEVYTGTGAGNIFTPYAQPELNIISCTRIDEVFGGGYGATAVMYCDPVVNINMIKGSFAENTTNGVPAVMTELNLTSASNPQALGVIGDVYGGGDAAAVYGNTTVNIGTATSVLVKSWSYDPATDVYTAEEKTVLGAYIRGNVYGGGKLADVGYLDDDTKENDPNSVYHDTFVNIGAQEVTENNAQVWKSVATAITILGNVYGGGKGEADGNTFKCDKAMVVGNTNVRIGNGTVGTLDNNDKLVAGTGNVYGGGEIGRVERGSTVTIGFETGTSQPVIKGYVFGAGSGVNTHGYSALVRGNSVVTVQGNAKVGGSVYGGGETASVGRYNIRLPGDTEHTEVEIGEPYALISGGKSTVTVQGNAEIGPDDMKMTATDGPDDAGHVFGAGKGVLPYQNLGTEGAGRYYLNGNVITWEPYGDSNEEDYKKYMLTLALSDNTDVTIAGNAFVKGSVYGGSENGHVRTNTLVKIQGGQIGAGYDTSTEHSLPKYSEDDFTNPAANSLATCAAWPYDKATTGKPYDMYAIYYKEADDEYYYDSEYEHSSEGGADAAHANDGHTFYGNVFAGGSGYYPYAPGKWLESAGSVGGNTVLNITGGHILSNVYGGNEQTNVVGSCTITMSGGTIGVPRTKEKVQDHPVVGNLFGAGKGDKRVLFNTWTNVASTSITITGGIVYGSVFGGGEDGHVMNDATTLIQEATGKTITIGSTGESGADGNVFGGGRGSETALTAGVVGGNVSLTINSGTIKGSVYGGGRLASVGTNFVNPDDEDRYGKLQSPDTDHGNITININNGTIGNANSTGISGNIYGGSKGTTTDFQLGIVRSTTINMTNGTAYASVYGGGELAQVVGSHTTSGQALGTEINISGGTIGTAKANLPEGTTYGATYGNVYGGGKGNTTHVEAGLINTNTKVSISQAESKTTLIRHNIYGGGAYGSVGEFNYDGTTGMPTGRKENTTGGKATIVIDGGTIGEDGHENGMIFGSSRGDIGAPGEIHDKLAWVYDTEVTVNDGQIKGSVYGGGENGHVYHDAAVNVHGGTIGISGEPDYAYRGNVYGAGCGTDKYYTDLTDVENPRDGNGNKYNPLAGIVYGDATVTIDGGHVVHNVYGAGAMGSVGTITNFDDLDDDTMNYKHDDETNDEHKSLYNFGLSWPYELTYGNTGLTKVTVKGTAVIGVSGSTGGHVFGAARGSVDVGQTDITDQRYEEAKLANVRETQVVIGTEGGSGTTTTPTIYGSVYGGGEDGHVNQNASITIHHGTIAHSVFGGGKGTSTYETTLLDIANKGQEKTDSENVHSWTAGKVYGNTTITMNGGSVGYSIYGGGNMASVGKGNYAGGSDDYSTVGYGELPPSNALALWSNTNFMNTGLATVNIYGGTVGAANTTYEGLPTGNVFGSSRGVAALSCSFSPRYKYVPDFFLGYVNQTSVTIGDDTHTPPTIYGSVYGGGENGHVRRSTQVTINKGTIGVENDVSENKLDRGNVFGAGSGVGKNSANAYNTSSGSVTCTTTVTVNNGTIYQNVYGGGAQGSVGPPPGGITADETNSESSAHKTYTKVVINGGNIGSANNAAGYGGYVFGASRGNADLNKALYATDVWSMVNVNGGTINGSVFGGGENGIVKCGVDVNITGGTIVKDVYGGGALADTQTSNWNATGGTNGEGDWATGMVVNGKTTYKTTVNLLGGTINDAYGGGLGQKVGDVNGGTRDVEATVYGDIQLNLNGLETADYVSAIHSTLVTDVDNTAGTYYLANNGCLVTGNVFGCNNINGTPKGHAKVHVFKTVNSTKSSSTPVDERTTYDVAAVFGGGNASDYVPADETQSTEVIIEGCDLTSIEEVYGGGYGAAVPGTNVLIKGTYIINNVFGGGYGAGSSNPEDANYNPGANVGYLTSGAAYSSGEGKAVVQLMAGTVNYVYGGSNTKGDIRGGSSITTVEKTNEPGCCANLSVKEIYGGGKSADMEGGAEIVLGCMPDDWIGEIYAGAQQADIGHDVSLTITSGKFERVFGGNNVSGNISGYVEVNIEENPECSTPIIIGELYGGGNMASYTIDEAYTRNNPNYQSPRVNVRSFTSIGTIYGGGLGTGAVVNANPMVNINVGMVRGGGQNYAGADKAGTLDVKLYPHVQNKIGVIGNVFGGGNAAQVNGNTYVNIGVDEYVKLDGIIAGETNVAGYYTRSRENESSPWVYTLVEPEAPETEVIAVSGTIYYLKVEGADIRGNVYGGGNEANVTGSTNVNIGKKEGN